MTSNRSRTQDFKKTSNCGSIVLRVSWMWLILTIIMFAVCLDWLINAWSEEQLASYKVQLSDRAKWLTESQARPLAADSTSNTKPNPVPDQTIPIFSHQGTYYTAQSTNQWPVECQARPTAPNIGKFDVIACSDGKQLLGLRTLVTNQSGESKEMFLWSILTPPLLFTQTKGVTLLACFLLFLGLSLLGARILSASIRESLQSFGQAMARLRNGDYQYRLAPSPLKELQDLTHQFNEMGQSIEDRDRYFRETAFQDRLTGLDNKAFLTLIVDQRIQKAAEPLYIMTWSIESLSEVYDVLGQDMIDHLLMRMAKKFRRLSPGHLALARLEDNLFAIAVPVDLFPKSRMPELARVLRLSVRTCEFSIEIDCHAGLVWFPKDGQCADTLLRRADLAREQAKKRKQAWLSFEPDMERQSAERLRLLGQMRDALEREEFELFLQPKLNLKENRVTQAEALIRWRHPDRGLVPPGEFIPLAEQTGLVREITQWALAKTYSILQQHAEIDLGISINLSTLDLENNQFLDRARDLRQAHPALASRISLEITESNTMNDPEKALKLLNFLADLGHRISVDDFGSGYSSLAYLKRFPVSELKIDRSLVHRADQDTDAAIIVQSTIEMGHTMGMVVTVEGVETEAEFALIHSLGADYLQGHYLSEALTLERFFSRFFPLSHVQKSCPGDPAHLSHPQN